MSLLNRIFNRVSNKLTNYINLQFFKHETIVNPLLIMTILAKDEADIIEEQIKFHKNMGVDSFIVTDNNSYFIKIWALIVLLSQIITQAMVP